MPSPFPGMDPFLEHPALFPDLHDRLVARLSETLQARLPEPYYAVVGARVWVESSRRTIGPDVEVLRPTGAPHGQAAPPGAGAVVAQRSRPLVIRVPYDEMRETLVEIRARHDPEDRLVTTVEVLSLANKAPGAHGRDLYLRKQGELLDSPCHLVEIDLLRAGQHATAVPLDRLVEASGPFDYHVCVHRFDHVDDFFVYPIRLDEPLPEVAIPLLPGDSDVPLDLQALFGACYDAGPYRRRNPYRAVEPSPPLRLEQRAWALGILQAHGLVPPS